MTEYSYKYCEFDEENNNKYVIKEKKYKINIAPTVSGKKIGVMIAGLGGNNGSVFTAGMLAKQKGLTFENRDGTQAVDLLGSLYAYGTVNLGYNNKGKVVSKLMRDMVDMKSVDDIVVDGWDICDNNLYDALKINRVLEPDLLRQLKDDLENITPKKAVYYPGFIAKNQHERAINILQNNDKWKDVDSILMDINNFKLKHDLDRVIVVYSGCTESYNNTDDFKTFPDLIRAIQTNSVDISPSIIYAVACVLSGGIFINIAAQNTVFPALLEMAKVYDAFIGGEDLRSGQTRLKSALVDWIACCGLRPLSIVSYNHLGNQDATNLRENPQFLSKKMSKTNVIDDVIAENPALFKGKKPDHDVIIRDIKAVNDDKIAMDHYMSEIFLGGRHHMYINSVCMDSLLAVPLILDIILFSELYSRVTITDENDVTVPFSSNLSLLSLFFKAPVKDLKNPDVNAFFKNIYAIKNFILACNGLPMDDFIHLHTRI